MDFVSVQGGDLMVAWIRGVFTELNILVSHYQDVADALISFVSLRYLLALRIIPCLFTCKHDMGYSILVHNFHGGSI